MIFKIKVYQDDEFWLVEVPALDIMTQSASLYDAARMLMDYIYSDSESLSFTLRGNHLVLGPALWWWAIKRVLQKLRIK